VLSNARIKSFFGRRFADEKKTNDAMRGTTKNTVSEQFDEAMQQRDESGEMNGVVVHYAESR
jgi:GTP cyclohydrolase II